VRLSCSTRGFPSFVTFFNLIFSIPAGLAKFLPGKSEDKYQHVCRTCCSVLPRQCVAEQCSALEYQHVCSMCSSLLQCVAACHGMLQCGAMVVGTNDMFHYS